MQIKGLQLLAMTQSQKKPPSNYFDRDTPFFSCLIDTGKGKKETRGLSPTLVWPDNTSPAVYVCIVPMQIMHGISSLTWTNHRSYLQIRVIKLLTGNRTAKGEPITPLAALI